MRYFINLGSDTEYEFDFLNSAKLDIDNYLENDYLDFDIDNDDFYTLKHEFTYLISKCEFFFDNHGGDIILNFFDYIDFFVYNLDDIRNLKYIYKKINYYEKDVKINDFYTLYDFTNDYIKNYNIVFYLNILKREEDEGKKKNLYLILRNTRTVDELSYKKRFFLIKNYNK